jgi:hypothetical protein
MDVVAALELWFSQVFDLPTNVVFPLERFCALGNSLLLQFQPQAI